MFRSTLSALVAASFCLCATAQADATSATGYYIFAEDVATGVRKPVSACLNITKKEATTIAASENDNTDRILYGRLPCKLNPSKG